MMRNARCIYCFCNIENDFGDLSKFRKYKMSPKLENEKLCNKSVTSRSDITSFNNIIYNK